MERLAIKLGNCRQDTFMCVLFDKNHLQFHFASQELHAVLFAWLDSFRLVCGLRITLQKGHLDEDWYFIYVWGFIYVLRAWSHLISENIFVFALVYDSKLSSVFSAPQYSYCFQSTVCSKIQLWSSNSSLVCEHPFSKVVASHLNPISWNRPL